MDFNTELVKEGVREIATLVSDLVLQCVSQKEDVGLDQVEQGMRQLLQQIGQEALGQVLTKSDKRASANRCRCGYEAKYRCRCNGMVITVFGRVHYKRSYYICEHCQQGEKPLDK